MDYTLTTDICRVTVIGPRRRVDIALPAHVSFAELFPVIAQYAGLDRAAVVNAPGGWVLQRLGQPPFEGPATPAQVGLVDGELVYLRPRAAELPETSSDDIADAITAVHDKPDRWRPADARRVGLGAGVAFLVAGVAAIVSSGPPWFIPAALAALIATVLLVAAVAVSRAAGDAGMAAVLGYAALPYAFLAGLAGSARPVPLTQVGALGLLAGFSALMLAAIVAGAGIADGLPVFFGVAVAAAAGVAAAWLAYATQGLGAAGAAALVVTPALALTPLIPAAAFRLARLPMPAVPASVDELRDDALMVSCGDVEHRAAAADRFVTGAVSGLGLMGAGAEVALGLGGGKLAPLMAVVLACVLLLRSRIFRGRAQRLWLMAPGYGGLAWLAVHPIVVAADRSTTHLALILLPLVAGSATVIGVGSWLSAHQPSPFWGRAADIADMFAIISLIPLALGVAGVFGYLHGLGG